MSIVIELKSAKMSFLQIVLKSTEISAMETLKKDLPNIKRKAAGLKWKVLDYLDKSQKSVLVDSDKITIDFLFQQTKDMLKTCECLRTTLNDVMKKSNPDIPSDDWYSDLDEVETNLTLCRKLCVFQQGLLEIERLYLEKDNKGDVFMKLSELEAHMCEISPVEKIDALPLMCYRLMDWKVVLTDYTNNLISESLNIVHKPKLDDTEMLTVTSKTNSTIMQAFELQAQLDDRIDYLDIIVRSLWKDVITSIVLYSTRSSKIELNGDVILKLNVKKDRQDSYLDVFDHLVHFFGFLRDNFNFNLKNGKTTLDYIGDEIRDELAELIVKNCLENKLPPKSDEKLYREMIDSVTTLQDFFVGVHIFTPEFKVLLDFIENAENLYITQICGKHRESSMKVMKKYLLDTTQVSLPNNTSTNDSSILVISKNILELISLVQDIMQEAIIASEACRKKLYTTARNIFFQYPYVVRELNQKFVQTAPEKVAIFYNNCLYLRANLHKGMEVDEPQFEFIQKRIHEAATETFQSYLNLIMDEIEDTIGGLTSINDIDLGVSKCINRLQSLKIWEDYLMKATYTTMIRVLLDGLCKSLCNVLIPLVKPEFTSELLDVLGIVLHQTLIDANEFDMNMVNWMKVLEIVEILNSNYEDVKNRKDEKTRMALTPQEELQLVRGLYG